MQADSVVATSTPAIASLISFFMGSSLDLAKLDDEAQLASKEKREVMQLRIKCKELCLRDRLLRHRSPQHTYFCSLLSAGTVLSHVVGLKSAPIGNMTQAESPAADTRVSATNRHLINFFMSTS